MPQDIIKKYYKIVGQGDLKAQFTLIPSGSLNIWFPETGLQMEAPCNQLRFENDTLLYTNGLHYSQARAFWSLTLNTVDMSELKTLIIEVCPTLPSIINTQLYPNASDGRELERQRSGSYGLPRRGRPFFIPSGKKQNR